MKMLLQSTSLVMSFGLALLAGSSAFAADTGHAEFLKYGCWQCHGTEGQGTPAGPKLAPEPLPYEGFAAFVRSTSRQMPPYREPVLPEKDLQAIHAYLSSRPPAVDVKKFIDP